MSDNDNELDKEFEIFYEGEESEDLNAQLDAMADMSGGEFVSSSTKKNLSKRKYKFEVPEDGDNFYEFANLAISRHFPMKFLSPEELREELYWTTEQAVYHHLGFTDKQEAHRFATMLRATLTAYMRLEMFDLLLLELPDDELPYTVIWAFPNDSLINFDFDGELEEEEDDENYFKFFEMSKNKKKEELN